MGYAYNPTHNALQSMDYAYNLQIMSIICGFDHNLQHT